MCSDWIPAVRRPGGIRNARIGVLSRPSSPKEATFLKLTSDAVAPPADLVVDGFSPFPDVSPAPSLPLLRNSVPLAAGMANTEDRLELLEAMVAGSREGLCVLSPAQVMLRANKVVAELLGFDPAAATGRPVHELGVQSDFDWSIGEEVATTGVAISSVQTLRNGRKLLISGVPVCASDGRLSYVVVTICEITGMGQVMSRLREASDLAERSRSTLAVAASRDLQIDEVVAHSESLAAVRERALQYAVVDSTILLLGETGAGKGIFARMIHQASARTAGPFLEVNCGAIPEGLMEAELFGYAKGAFTGADSKGKIGLVELAHKGTLLLNEIGDLPLSLQVKLLRFLEDGGVWAVGAVKPKRPDVRIIAATNRDLRSMISAGSFRGDLFYRLNVLTLQIPPLREHPEDIPRLVELALTRLERKVNRRRTITPKALAVLSQYSFPGNVRELLNLVERLMVTATRNAIDITDLSPEIQRATGDLSLAFQEAGPTLKEALQQVERQLLRAALERYKTQVRAAKFLGVTQSTVARKAKQYGLCYDGRAS
jgi:transcriptional regulator with PAS, ATPase and Fis domain